VGPGRERGLCCFADMDRAVVEHDNDGLRAHAWFWAVQAVEGFQKGYEVGAAFGARCRDDGVQPNRALPSSQPSSIALVQERANLHLAWPKLGRDKDVSTPRSRQRTAARCRLLQLGLCATSTAAQREQSHRQSAVPSAYDGAAGSGIPFLAQHLGEL